MGTFLGHLVPGMALACLGLWHVLNTVRTYYLHGSAKFTSRFWYPLKCPLCKLENLELALILSFSVLAVLMQLIEFPFLHFSFKLVNFEHATMFLYLAIFAGFTLLAELSNLSEILYGVSGILACAVFWQELFLLHYHSTDHVGLEGHYHWLLQLIVCVSLLAALAATSCPTSFPAALVLSISVVLQGCWFMIMGFMLWVPHLIPQGCVSQMNDANSSIVHEAVICESNEASSRARALANLQFSWMVSAVLIFVAGICLTFPRNPAPKGPSTNYEQLHCRVADVPLSVTGFNQNDP